MIDPLDPLIACLVQPALEIGFNASLGTEELFKLGGCLTQDNELWGLVEKA
jgi:hypothetical protein